MDPNESLIFKGIVKLPLVSLVHYGRFGRGDLLVIVLFCVVNLMYYIDMNNNE